ncbi:MAG: rod shape-determining protein MreD [Roseovarius sp.]|nr:rod shape-determining protein MreD [Roseovarius sp.]
MAERFIQRYWLMRALYLILCIVLIFMHLLPLDTQPSNWTGPDLVLAITFVWVLRRPEYVPVLLIALVALGMDLLFQRPPGLWAACVVMGAETLRNRVPTLRDLSFAAEWASVASTMVLITLAYRLVLSVLMVDQAPLGLSLMQLLFTLMVYPVVAFASGTLMGVRRATPGDLDANGRRI